MFIRFKKSGIPGITSKCAYCSLMTQTRLFFVSFQSQMMYFPGCWKEKIMPLPCQRNGELGCSLGLVHSNTIISGWWSNRINFKWKLTFRNVFVSVLLQRPRVLISLLPLLSYSSFSNISFFLPGSSVLYHWPSTNFFLLFVNASLRCWIWTYTSFEPLMNIGSFVY